MNANTRNLNHHESPIIPFQPQTSDEAITAKVIRMMLNFEVLRVQLEGGRPNLTESQRVSMRQQATAIRTLGFRTEREAITAGVPLSYDDDLLRREGTRIAYLLARNAFDQAMLVEKDVITISVNKALYDIDEDRMTIAAAA